MIDDNTRFIRVGNDYLERGFKIDTRKRKMLSWNKRSKEHIIDDYGKEFLKTIPKFYDFCIVPDHHNYEQVIAGNFNLYHKVDTEASKGSIKTWETMINHIGGDQSDLLWDYVQLLWQNPLQMLPVLCLVSKEQGTGKSTFGDALSYLLKENLGFYTQTDLNSTFNNWIAMTVSVFEEISDTQRAINIIKAMSTARLATINRKYQQPVTFAPFCKIIINTNSEDSFIKANENDIRYWVIRVPVLPEAGFSPTFLEDLESEVPAVIYFLNNRQLSVPNKQSRMWFSPESLRTEALLNVIKESRTDTEKEVAQAIQDKLEEVERDICFTPKDIIQWIGSHNLTPYKTRMAIESLGYKEIKGRYTDVMGMSKNNRHYTATYIPDDAGSDGVNATVGKVNMPFDDEELIEFDFERAPF